MQTFAHCNHLIYLNFSYIVTKLILNLQSESKTIKSFVNDLTRNSLY